VEIAVSKTRISEEFYKENSAETNRIMMLSSSLSAEQYKAILPLM
jgi:hypothetical protein